MLYEYESAGIYGGAIWFGDGGKWQFENGVKGMKECVEGLRKK